MKLIKINRTMVLLIMYTQAEKVHGTAVIWRQTAILIVHTIVLTETVTAIMVIIQRLSSGITQIKNGWRLTIYTHLTIKKNLQRLIRTFTRVEIAIGTAILYMPMILALVRLTTTLTKIAIPTLAEAM